MYVNEKSVIFAAIFFLFIPFHPLFSIHAISVMCMVHMKCVMKMNEQGLLLITSALHMKEKGCEKATVRITVCVCVRQMTLNQKRRCVSDFFSEFPHVK